MIIVGLTYDLKDDYLAKGFSKEDAAEFDKPQTIDAIEKALLNNGYVVERVGNLQALVHCLAQGKRWDIVFNICEGVKGVAREAQVPALLEAYHIPFVFSDAETMVITMDKALAKRLVAEQGVPTARFAVIKTTADAERVDLPFPLFAKPLAEGTGKGISKASYIENKDDLLRQCRLILEKFDQSVLIEEYLPGRDLTVGITGTGETARVVGVMESFYKEENAKYEGQSFYNKEHWTNTLSYEIAGDTVARDAADIALKSWKILGCKDGGRVDLRCDRNGTPHFLEVNPLAGLQPGFSDFPMLAEKMGINYDSLIGQIIKEACVRQGLDENFVSDRGGTVTLSKSRIPFSNKIRSGLCVTETPWSEQQNMPISIGTRSLIGENKKKIVILYSGEDSFSREDEKDTLDQLKEITGEVEQLNYAVFSVPFTGDTSVIEKKIKQYRPDMVFNLVESVDQSDKLQYAATVLLERMNIPYTGASTRAIAMLSSKVYMKTILQQTNIPTPLFYFNENETRLAPSLGEFRWIVKSDTEHASVGIDSDSVVGDLDKAVRLIKEKEQFYGGGWFAEQYIDGREFNFAMLGQAGREPQVLPPAEIVFKNYPDSLAKIVDYGAKWEKESFSYHATQRRYAFEAEDQKLLDQMKAISLKCWRIFGLAGAARIDFRVDNQGQPWVVDINANPCLSSDAGFMAAAARIGITQRDVIHELLALEDCHVPH